MKVGHDPHYNIAQAQSTSNESDNFFSQSGVILFRASNESDNFFNQSGVILFRASNESDNFSATQVSYCYDVFDLGTSCHS
jgi:hypothetical protein